MKRQRQRRKGIKMNIFKSKNNKKKKQHDISQIINDIKHGDSEAFSELYNLYHNEVFKIAMTNVHDYNKACDVTQETFIEIFKTLASLNNADAFHAWVKKITYHKCTAYFRSKEYRHELLANDDEEAQLLFETIEEDRSEFIPEASLDTKELSQTIRQFIDELPEAQRDALTMYYYNEASINEIAEIQGVGADTVKSRLFYARKSLKNAIEEYEKKHGISLHGVMVLPMFKWALDGAEYALSAEAASVIAGEVSTATGMEIAAGTATTALSGSVAGSVGASVGSTSSQATVLTGAVSSVSTATAAGTASAAGVAGATAAGTASAVGVAGATAAGSSGIIASAIAAPIAVKVTAVVVAATVIATPAGVAVAKKVEENRDSEEKYEETVTETTFDTFFTTGLDEAEPNTAEPDEDTTVIESEKESEDATTAESESETESEATEPPYVNVTGISVDKWEVTITETETTTITATIAPGDANNKAVTWASNNIGVATVDENGNIYGVATGDCYVTATSVDNSEIVAWIKVVVMPQYALPADQVPEDIAETYAISNFDYNTSDLPELGGTLTSEEKAAIAQDIACCKYCNQTRSLYHINSVFGGECPHCGDEIPANVCHDCVRDGQKPAW